VEKQRLMFVKKTKEMTMIQKIGAVCIGILFIIALNAGWAQDGETIFKSQGCRSCHRERSTSKVNPSLAEIAMVYQGKQEQLIKFLKGESEAIVRPKKAYLMKRHIEKTKKLSDADLKSLTGYLLDQKSGNQQSD
jgi:cytochrome c